MLAHRKLRRTVNSLVGRWAAFFRLRALSSTLRERVQQQQSLLARKRRPARLVPLALATRSSSPATSISSYRRVLALEPRYSLWPCLASFLASPHHVEYSTSCKPAFLCAAVVRCIRAASLRMCARSSPSPFERSSFGRFTRLCAARHHCGVAVSERQHVSLGWEVPFVLLKPQTLQTVRCQAPPWPTICVRVCACTLVPRVLVRAEEALLCGATVCRTSTSAASDATMLLHVAPRVGTNCGSQLYGIGWRRVAALLTRGCFPDRMRA